MGVQFLDLGLPLIVIQKAEAECFSKLSIKFSSPKANKLFNYPILVLNSKSLLRINSY